jgi:hypothetical protein
VAAASMMTGSEASSARSVAGSGGIN